MEEVVWLRDTKRIKLVEVGKVGKVGGSVGYRTGNGRNIERLSAR
jgi:hypothetical protein